MSKPRTVAFVAGASAAGVAAMWGIARVRSHVPPPPVTRALTVDVPIDAAPARWLSALPVVAEPLAAVECQGDSARWTLHGAGRSRAVTTTLRRGDGGRRLVWTSDNGGLAIEVAFREAAAMRGTETYLTVRSPLAAALSGPALREVLRRFKSTVETGEIPTLERNPSGREAA